MSTVTYLLFHRKNTVRGLEHIACLQILKRQCDTIHSKLSYSDYMSLQGIIVVLQPRTTKEKGEKKKNHYI